MSTEDAYKFDVVIAAVKSYVQLPPQCDIQQETSEKRNVQRLLSGHLQVHLADEGSPFPKETNKLMRFLIRLAEQGDERIQCVFSRYRSRDCVYAVEIILRLCRLIPLPYYSTNNIDWLVPCINNLLHLVLLQEGGSLFHHFFDDVLDLLEQCADILGARVYDHGGEKQDIHVECMLRLRQYYSCVVHASDEKHTDDRCLQHSVEEHFGLQLDCACCARQPLEHVIDSKSNCLWLIDVYLGILFRITDAHSTDQVQFLSDAWSRIYSVLQTLLTTPSVSKLPVLRLLDSLLGSIHVPTVESSKMLETLFTLLEDMLENMQSSGVEQKLDENAYGTLLGRVLFRLVHVSSHQVLQLYVTPFLRILPEFLHASKDVSLKSDLLRVFTFFNELFTATQTRLNILTPFLDDFDLQGELAQCFRLVLTQISSYNYDMLSTMNRTMNWYPYYADSSTPAHETKSPSAKRTVKKTRTTIVIDEDVVMGNGNTSLSDTSNLSASASDEMMNTHGVSAANQHGRAAVLEHVLDEVLPPFHKLIQDVTESSDMHLRNLKQSSFKGPLQSQGTDQDEAAVLFFTKLSLLVQAYLPWLGQSKYEIARLGKKRKRDEGGDQGAGFVLGLVLQKLFDWIEVASEYCQFFPATSSTMSPKLMAGSTPLRIITILVKLLRNAAPYLPKLYRDYVSNDICIVLRVLLSRPIGFPDKMVDEYSKQEQIEKEQHEFSHDLCSASLRLLTLLGSTDSQSATEILMGLLRKDSTVSDEVQCEAIRTLPVFLSSFGGSRQKNVDARVSTTRSFLEVLQILCQSPRDAIRESVASVVGVLFCTMSLTSVRHNNTPSFATQSGVLGSMTAPTPMSSHSFSFSLGSSRVGASSTSPQPLDKRMAVDSVSCISCDEPTKKATATSSLDSLLLLESPSVTGPTQVSPVSANHVDVKLLYPFLALLSDGEENAHVKAAMAMSFFRCLRHVKVSQLREVTSYKIEPSGPTLSVNLASQCLNLLFDEQECVRRSASEHIKLLVDDQQKTGPFVSLFAPASDGVSDEKRRMEDAVRGFIKQMREFHNHMYSTDKPMMTYESYIAVGGVAARLPTTCESQCTLLWLLMNQLNSSIVSMRAICYEKINDVALKYNLATAELIELHKVKLYPMILDAACETPLIIDHMCDALMDMSTREFIDMALPAVYPQIVVDKSEKSLKALADLIDEEESAVVIEYIPKVLSYVLLGHVTSHVAVRKIFRYLRKHTDTHTFTGLIRLCHSHLLLELIWALGNVEHVEPAKIALQLIVAAHNDILTDDDLKAYTEPSEGDHVPVYRLKDPAVFDNYMSEHFLHLLDDLSELILDGQDTTKKLRVNTLIRSLDPSIANRVNDGDPAHNRKWLDRVARHALRSLEALIDVGSGALRSFVVKIMGVLKLALANVAIRSEVLNTWDVFVHKLDDQYLGPCLGEIVVNLMPYAEDVKDQGRSDPKHEENMTKIVSIFDYLFVKKRLAMRKYFKDIPLLPTGNENMKPVVRLIEKEIGEISFEERLRQLTRLISQEGGSVRQQALKQLQHTLRANAEEIALRSLEEEFSELLGNIVTVLMACCSDSSLKVKGYTTACIGELGAIDPGHLNVHVFEESSSEHHEYDNDVFAVYLIEKMLLKALRDNGSRRGANRVLLAIQEILKFLGCTQAIVDLSETFQTECPSEWKQLKLLRQESTVDGDTQASHKSEFDLLRDRMNAVSFDKFKRSLSRNELVREEQMRGMRNWLCFKDSTMSAIKPCVSSRYYMQPDAADPSKQNDGESKSKSSAKKSLEPVHPSTTNLRKWMSDWSRVLIERTHHHKRGDGREKIFQAMRGAVKSDPQSASFLLPYLVDDALTHGTKQDMQSIKEEILKVLQLDTSLMVHAGDDKSSLHSIESNLIRQQVFELIDLLTIWYNDERMDHVKKVMQERMERRRSTKNRPKKKTIPEKRGLIAKRELLNAIPKRILAEAAHACKAYTRSVRYFEMYLREVASEAPARDQGHPNIKEGIHHSYAGTKGLGDLFDISPEDLRFFQRIYTGIDDADGMIGAGSLRRSKPSLEEQIHDFESQHKWAAALTCYEQALQIDPDNVSNHTGFIQCLHQLGHHRTAITHIHGSFRNSKIDHTVLASHGIAASWRLGQWDLVQEFVDMTPERTFEVGLGKILDALFLNDEKMYSTELSETRGTVLGNLSAASRESYQRAHPYFVHLHVLQEIDRIKETFGMPKEYIANNRAEQSTRARMATQDDTPLETALNAVIREFDDRLARSQATFRVREQILSSRRQIFSLYGMGKQNGEAWLELAKEARYASQFETAAGAVLQAQRHDKPPKRLFIEQAKLLRDTGRLYDAMLEMERHFKDQEQQAVARARTGRNKLSASEQLEVKQINGMTALLSGEWVQETGAKGRKDVINYYKRAISCMPKSEKAYFLQGRYYEKVLLQYLALKENEEGKDRARIKAKARFSKEAVELLHQVIMSYGISLTHGNQYVFESLPKMITTWLDYGVEWDPRHKAATRNAKDVAHHEIHMKLGRVHNMMCGFVTKLAPHVWLTALPQIISRIGHSDPKILEFLMDVIACVFVAYPQQSLWTMAGLFNSSDSTRRRRAETVLHHKVKNQQHRGNLKQIIDQGLGLVKNLIAVCTHPISSQSRKTSLSVKSQFPSLMRLKPNVLIVPIQVAMTVRLPPTVARVKPSDIAAQNSSYSSSMASYAGGDRKDAYRCFPEMQVMISSFHDEIEVIKSKEKPRKVSLLGSDGKTYTFLCKKEDRGDMRKNSRMMEFATVINRLLKKNPASRSRQLALRTYAVLPLTEECGLIEWVPRTTTFRKLCDALYADHNIFMDFRKIKTDMDEAGTQLDRRVEFYRKCMRNYPAVFYEWFLVKFPEPATWFANRASYTHSVAVWSMVGFVVGLGDRHGENILIDESNGVAVHVDFDCLFNKGEKLDTPERVPFRLTPNIVSAFGVSGVAGAFRRACEITMSVMRENQRGLMSVLDTFVHDPLVEWKKDHARNHSTSSQGRGQEIMKAMGSRLLGFGTMSSLERSQMESETLAFSVHGQVHQLILQATSEENLSRMYIGWMSWL